VKQRQEGSSMQCKVEGGKGGSGDFCGKVRDSK
jgi:hypothetical protein